MEIKQLGSKAAALVGMVMMTALAGALIMVAEGTWEEDHKPGGSPLSETRRWYAHQAPIAHE